MGKRSKTSSTAAEEDGIEYQENGGGSDLEQCGPVPIPTNPVNVPSFHTFLGVDDTTTTSMSEQDVSTHRENFYQKLLGISASEVDLYTPSLAAQANLRGKGQLAKAIHIVDNWDTGADGLDAAAFRSQYKTWYSRMKPVFQSINLGRRTGFHLRTTEEGGEKVLCRYNDDATDSIVYLDVSQLYDALFEIHCMEHNHERGISAVKVRANELYANVPEGQVKAFMNTCPVCLQKKGSQLQQQRVGQESLSEKALSASLADSMLQV